MRLNTLYAKLLNAARTDKPSEQVPFSFEKRIMAHIRSHPVPDAWALWSAALWRAAAPYAAIAILFGTWTVLIQEPPSTAPEEQFAQHFENTVLADITAEQSLE